MKKFTKIISAAVFALAAATSLTSVAKADWEYVRTGIVCVDAENAAQLEMLINERLYTAYGYVAIVAGRGHKKVSTPVRIVDTSTSNVGAGWVRGCVTIESITP